MPPGSTAWRTGRLERGSKFAFAVFSLGNPGDVKSVGNGVSEMRIDYGPGYRVYFSQRGAVLVVLLCGGDKRTQSRDIARAVEMARRL